MFTLFVNYLSQKKPLFFENGISYTASGLSKRLILDAIRQRSDCVQESVVFLSDDLISSVDDARFDALFESLLSDPNVFLCIDFKNKRISGFSSLILKRLKDPFSAIVFCYSCRRTFSFLKIRFSKQRFLPIEAFVCFFLSLACCLSLQGIGFISQTPDEVEINEIVNHAKKTPFNALIAQTNLPEGETTFDHLDYYARALSTNYSSSAPSFLEFPNRSTQGTAVFDNQFTPLIIGCENDSKKPLTYLGLSAYSKSKVEEEMTYQDIYLSASFADKFLASAGKKSYDSLIGESLAMKTSTDGGTSLLKIKNIITSGDKYSTFCGLFGDFVILYTGNYGKFINGHITTLFFSEMDCFSAAQKLTFLRQDVKKKGFSTEFYGQSSVSSPSSLAELYDDYSDFVVTNYWWLISLFSVILVFSALGLAIWLWRGKRNPKLIAIFSFLSLACSFLVAYFVPARISFGQQVAMGNLFGFTSSLVLITLIVIVAFAAKRRNVHD